jgi:hypothetical protein
MLGTGCQVIKARTVIGGIKKSEWGTLVPRINVENAVAGS